MSKMSDSIVSRCNAILTDKILSKMSDEILSKMSDSIVGAVQCNTNRQGLGHVWP